jgi:hypothetical protein
MSPSRAAVRTLAFGDLDTGAWGTAFAADAGGFLVLGAGERTDAASAELSAAHEAGDWRLEGDRTTLSIAPAGAAVPVQTAGDGLGAVMQLCRISGRFQLDGSDHEVDSAGLRTWCQEPLELDRFQSIRAVSTWFDSGEGFVLTALRPRKARAHDGDLVAAAVLGPERSAPVADPRLSTTYSAEGWPVRAGLELWLDDDDEQEQYPRRASGEATGARALGALGEMELRAQRFRWHSRGRDGAGVYLLAQRR